MYRLGRENMGEKWMLFKRKKIQLLEIGMRRGVRSLFYVLS